MSEEKKVSVEIAPTQTDKSLIEVIGTNFVDHDGKAVTLGKDECKDVNCVYVSSSWCGPCKVFTPKLSKWYSDLVAAKKSLLVTFASFDSSQEEFETYFEKMSFPFAFPFQDPQIEKFTKRFGINSIPTLVVFDKHGNLLHKDGVEMVKNFGLSAYEKFLSK